MNTSYRYIVFLCLLFGLGACAKQVPPKDYTAYRAANPRSILVVPVTNKSTQVDAPDNFLVTLPIPLASMGYYVFPVHMVKRVMEDEGLADADLVHNADARKISELFGADAVLLAEIKKWDSQYIILSTTTTVSVHYTLKSGRTGQTIWEQEVTTQYSPQNTNTGNPIANLVAAAITAAIERADPHYLPLAHQANLIAVATKDQGLLLGPYHPAYGK
jgi:hypothetical protein